MNANTKINPSGLETEGANIKIILGGKHKYPKLVVLSKLVKLPKK